MGHREVKKNTETELSCAITEIGAAMKITWTGYTDNFKLLPAEGSERSDGFDTRTQSQTSTLTVGSEAVISDATYTCTVSSVLSGNLFETKNFDVQLFVYGKRKTCTLHSILTVFVKYMHKLVQISLFDTKLL